MTQCHAKYEQEVIYGTTYDRYKDIWKIHSKLVYVGLAQARHNKAINSSTCGENRCTTVTQSRGRKQSCRKRNLSATAQQILEAAAISTAYRILTTL